ncbi:MAG TPA: hypothetical protein ENK18_05020 [Deltaproteobacteria bacterium]|nr:hypothetical protein [Deltaproteobacteria bacterium]
MSGSPLIPACALALALALASCGYRGPDCEDLRHSLIYVDTSTATPTFDWDGDNPNGFAVLDSLGQPTWELHCACKADVDDPDGRLSCRDRVDREFRACLTPPLTYGQLPPIDTLSTATELQTTAAPLVPGETYTALLWTYCDALGPSQRFESTDFVAPGVGATIP